MKLLRRVIREVELSLQFEHAVERGDIHDAAIYNAGDAGDRGSLELLTDSVQTVPVPNVDLGVFVSAVASGKSVVYQ